MDIIENAKKIQDKIMLLEKGREKLEKAGEEKALAIANYSKELAKATIRLKNGQSVSIDEETTDGSQATLNKVIASGVVSQFEFEKEMAEIAYKNIIIKLECICSELNALQSINRYLKHEA